MRFLMRLFGYVRISKASRWGIFGMVNGDFNEDGSCKHCGGYGAVQKVTRMQPNGQDGVNWVTEMGPCDTCGENWAFKKMKAQADRELRFKKHSDPQFYSGTDVTDLEVHDLERKDKKAE